MKYKYQRVRDLREDQDKTQTQIAEILGEYLTTYQRWESGDREIPTHTIKQLAMYYNVSADYILGLPQLPYPKR